MSTPRRSAFSRLKGRSIAELRFRGAQVARSWLERAGVGDLGEPAANGIVKHLRPGSSHETAQQWCAAFRRRGGAGFFAGFENVERTTQVAGERDPAGSAAVIGVATRALDGRFDLLGHRNLSFGTPIDWHLDPVLKRSSPRTHWSRIPYLDATVAGDHKVVWELNRHQWLVSLGQAWRLTRDARYATAVDQALVAWMDSNPPKVGINWASSLEVAFRAISWLWTFRLLEDAESLRDETVLRAVGHLRIAARHLERNLSTYFSPNTHLTGEALALYYLGHELRDLDEAARWRDTGRRVLLEWLPTHVRPDGTYFEQSTWYHRYTLDFYVHFWLLSQRAGDALPDRVPEAIGRLGNVLMHVMRGDGTMPLIGDDDGGRLLFLDGRTSHDARPALANAGLVSERPALCASGDATTETLWLLGSDAATRLASLKRYATRPAPSRLFPDGGMVVMRDGWEPDASLVVMDAGPHGAMNCGHAHADALAIDVTWEGAPLFVDPGTFVYTTNAATRDAFRATASHNATTVDGASSSEMAGPFSWGRKATTRVTHWRSGRLGDCVVASHDGFDDRGSRPFACQRIVLRIPTGSGSTWVVLDRFHAARDVTFAAHFQCEPRVNVRPGEGRMHLHQEGADVAELLAFGGPIAQTRGSVSSTYGASEPAPHLAIERRGSGALTICSLVAGPGVAAPAYHEDRDALSLVIPNGSTELVVLSGEASTARQGDLAFDGVALWGEREVGSGTLLWWEAVGARRVAIGPSVILDFMDPRDAGWLAGSAPLNSN